MIRTTIALSSLITFAACSETISPDDATCRKIDESTFEIVSTHDGRVIASTDDAQPYKGDPSELKGTFNSNFGIEGSDITGFSVDLSPNPEESTCEFYDVDQNTRYTYSLELS